MKKFMLTLILCSLLSIITVLNAEKIESLFKKDKKSEVVKTLPNKFYEKFLEVGKTYGLDVTHTQTLHDSESYDIRDSEIFTSPDHSFDILIFGDSSAMVGLSQVILRQVTGLKISIIAVGSCLANARYARTIDRIARRFLKPGGVVMLDFHTWGYSQNRNLRQGRPDLDELEDMDDTLFGAFVNYRRSRQFPWSAMFSQIAFDHYTHSLAALFSPGSVKLRLPDISYYTSYIEPHTAPTIALKKQEHQATPTTGHFMAEPHQVLWITDTFKEFRQDLSSDNNLSYQTDEVRANATAMLKISAPLVYLIPFNMGTLPQTRNLFETFFQSKALIADLSATIPLDLSIPFVGSTHPANAGSLVQSVFLGRWINTHLPYLASSTLTTPRAARAEHAQSPCLPIHLVNSSTHPQCVDHVLQVADGLIARNIAHTPGHTSEVEKIDFASDTDFQFNVALSDKELLTSVPCSRYDHSPQNDRTAVGAPSYCSGYLVELPTKERQRSVVELTLTSHGALQELSSLEPFFYLSSEIETERAESNGWVYFKSPLHKDPGAGDIIFLDGSYKFTLGSEEKQPFLEGNKSIFKGVGAWPEVGQRIRVIDNRDPGSLASAVGRFPTTGLTFSKTNAKRSNSDPATTVFSLVLLLPLAKEIDRAFIGIRGPRLEKPVIDKISLHSLQQHRKHIPTLSVSNYDFDLAVNVLNKGKDGPCPQKTLACLKEHIEREWVRL